MNLLKPPLQPSPNKKDIGNSFQRSLDDPNVKINYPNVGKEEGRPSDLQRKFEENFKRLSSANASASKTKKFVPKSNSRTGSAVANNGLNSVNLAK